MFKTNNWLKNLIILLWLSFNLWNWAADGIPKVDGITELIKNDSELAAAMVRYKRGGDSKICEFADCLKLLNNKSFKLHMLAFHATKELKEAHSLCCDKCGHLMLQEANLNSHQIDKHGMTPKELGVERTLRGAKRQVVGTSVESVSALAPISAPKRARIEKLEMSVASNVIDVVKVSFFLLDDTGASTKAIIEW